VFVTPELQNNGIIKNTGPWAC